MLFEIQTQLQGLLQREGRSLLPLSPPKPAASQPHHAAPTQSASTAATLNSGCDAMPLPQACSASVALAHPPASSTLEQLLEPAGEGTVEEAACLLPHVTLQISRWGLAHHLTLGD